MANLNKVVYQLKQERNRAQSEVDKLDAALAVLRKLSGNGRRRRARPRRKMSAASRARIAAAQRARWAKVRKASRGS